MSPSNKLSFEDIPNGLAALGKVPFAGWIQIIGYCAYCEISAGYDADINKRTPGDMGWNPPLFSGNDPETKTRRLNAELANGRLAMMAIIGMFFQDGFFFFFKTIQYTASFGSRSKPLNSFFRLFSTNGAWQQR